MNVLRQRPVAGGGSACGFEFNRRPATPQRMGLLQAATERTGYVKGCTFGLKTDVLNLRRTFFEPRIVCGNSGDAFFNGAHQLGRFFPRKKPEPKAGDTFAGDSAGPVSAVDDADV